jgi:hypothetical protein
MRNIRQSGFAYDAASVAGESGVKPVFLPSNYAVEAGSASRNSASDAPAAARTALQ